MISSMTSFISAAMAPSVDDLPQYEHLCWDAISHMNSRIFVSSKHSGHANLSSNEDHPRSCSSIHRDFANPTLCLRIYRIIACQRSYPVNSRPTMRLFPSELGARTYSTSSGRLSNAAVLSAGQSRGKNRGVLGRRLNENSMNTGDSRVCSSCPGTHESHCLMRNV